MIIKESRKCIECKSNKTYMKDGKYPMWQRINDQLYCNKCYMRIFIAPNNNQRRIKYKGKYKYVGTEVRTGICSLCRKQGQTQMHHINYHDDDVLKDTIELCIQCHNKQRIGMKYNKCDIEG